MRIAARMDTIGTESAFEVTARARALEAQGRSIVHLQLGEALRLEMASAVPDAGDTVHLQYYIATELGPWALWLSCPRTEVADSEAFLRDLTPPLEQE